jgi:glycosyltransferase involved in cell wall biosynthesis
VAILADFPLHVIPSWITQSSGGRHYATWLVALAEAWSQPDGIERIWITLSDSVSTVQEFTFWNQTFIVLPTASKGRASSFYKKDRAAIAEALRRIQPDVVHGWGTEDVYAWATVTSGRPNILSMQGLLSHYILHTWINSRTFFQGLLELYLLRKAQVVTCESRWARPILQRRAPGVEIVCVEYGVHADFFNANWTPDPQRPAALFAGTLEKRKGFHDVLKAFRSPQLQSCELWVAGSGRLEDRAGTPPNVKWLGRLDRAQMIEKMSQAWCLVLPTRADTSPNVVKESRVIGLPVITTRCGGQSDYIEDGRNGFLVPTGDVATLTDRLHRVLSNAEYCRTLGANGWEKDRAFFRPELTARRFSELYRDLAARPKPVRS